MIPLEARVAQILEEQKLRQIELAKEAGVTKALVGQWLGGERLEMGFDAATKLHRRYGYAIAWLIKGEGPKMASEQAQAQARGADVSDEALEIARAFDRLKDPERRDHVRRQIEFLRGADMSDSGRRRAAQQDVEFKRGEIKRPKQRKRA